MKYFAVALLAGAALISAAGAAEPVLDQTRFFAVRIPAIMNDDAPGLPAAAAVVEKSRGKAFLLSVLLPGLGERYAGANKKSQIFLGTEIGLWLGYAGFLTYGDWRQEEYQSFAAAHAGIDPKGKTDAYYVNIGNYSDIDQYNAAKLRQRDLYDYYRDFDTWHWHWDSAENQARFDQMRVAADRANNRATFVLGAIFANHLLSAIDAVWSVHQFNRDQASRVEWNLQFGDGLIQPSLLFSLQTHF
jgi:hypothetical protein